VKKSINVFGGLIIMGKLVYTNCGLAFWLKNDHAKFLRVGNWVFVGLAFVKC
jgi:hypothetical protein